jgi:hypothetical protein
VTVRFRRGRRRWRANEKDGTEEDQAEENQKTEQTPRRQR